MVTPIALRHPEAARWASASCAALVDHVMARFHTPQRRQLQELQGLARTLEARQPADSAYPFGLADQVSAIAQEVESHMRKEEQLLFPLLQQQGGAAQAQALIAVMRMEHREHGEELQRLEALTGGLRPPPQADAAWQTLYAHLRSFGRDLHAHVLFENHILFVRAAH